LRGESRRIELKRKEKNVRRTTTKSRSGKRGSAVHKPLAKRTNKRGSHTSMQFTSESQLAAPTPFDPGPGAVFDPDLRHRMISEAAYYLYTQRGYADGYDLDDWLEAEAQVDDLIMNPQREDTTEVSAPLASP
jgi:hypothetical protein